MQTYQRKFTNLENVAASQLSTLNVPARNNYHALLLNFKSAAGVALTQAQIETDVAWVSITLTMIDGKTIKIMDRMKPAEIFDLLNDFPEKAFSTYTNAGTLCIPFTKKGRVPAETWKLALGMADVDVFLLEVQYTAGLATAAVVEVIPEIDKEPARPLGGHIEYVIEERSRATTGEEPVDNAPHKEEGTALLGYHIGLGATGVISKVEVELDTDTVYSNLDAAMNNLNLHRRRFSPNADYFHVIFDLDGQPLPVGAAKSFINKWTWSTAPGSYRVIYEKIVGMTEKNA